MVSKSPVELADPEFDVMAREFLGSPYAGDRFIGWPIDQRLDAYLRRRGLTGIADDGTAFVSLLDKVMANIAVVRNRATATRSAGGAAAGQES